MADRSARIGRRRGVGGGPGTLFALACLSILALTFLLGVLVGRQWGHHWAGADHTRLQGGGPSQGGRARAGRLGERDVQEPASRIQDKLTFYQTLTAPLTAGPPPAPKRTAAEPARSSAPAASPAGRGASDVRYTIQVAAFKSRAQADKLRETLGSEAYVAEIGAGQGAPFRVRIGSFASRGDAEARAVRFRAEHPLGAFVTQQ
jgi:sporulation related protein